MERAGALWAGAVLALWVALHLPLATLDALWLPGTGPALAAAGSHLSPLAWLPVLAPVVLGLAGTGARVVARLGAQTTPAETLAFGAAVGLGLAATALAVAGLAGGFTRAGLTAVVASMVAAGAPWPELRQAARELLGTFDIKRVEPLAALMALISAGALALALAKACAPPWYPDALFYHLALPRLYLDAGRFVPVPQEPVNAGHPGLVQVLFAVPMAWGRDDLCGAISWVFHLLGVAAAGLLAGRRGAACAVAAAATLPHLAFVDAAPLADAALFAFVGLAVHATARALDADAGWARVASLTAGFALATKYQAAVPVALIALALGAGFTRAWGPARMLGLALPCAALALAPFAPWAARNVSFYGGPFAPVVTAHGDPPPARALLAAFRADWVTHGHRAAPPWVPFDLTFAARPDDLAAYEGEPGPLPLMLAPFALAALALGRRERALAGFVALEAGGWLLGARELRYLFPLVPAYLALALARAPLRAVEPLVAAGALAALVWLAGYARPGTDLLYLAGAESRADYYRSLAATGPLFRACEALNATSGARVLFFWEDRGYFCRVPYLADHLVPGSTTDLLHELPGEPAALAARLRAMRVTHLLVNRTAWDEARGAGLAWTFSGPLERFLHSGGVHPLPGLGPADHAGVEVWRLAEPVPGAPAAGR